MEVLLSSIAPILGAILGGWGIGRLCPSLRPFVSSAITPLVWLLLFCIGCEFGGVLNTAAAIAHNVRTALLFAGCTTLLPWVVIAGLSKTLAGSSAEGENRHRRSDTSVPLDALNPLSAPSTHSRLHALWKPIKECLIALGCVAGGVIWSTAIAPHLSNASWPLSAWIPSATALLYLLILFIGIDLSAMKWDPSWKSHRMWIVPLLVVITSLLGGLLAAYCTAQPIPIALALSSGFGWFSLSGVLISAHLGQTYGVIALLTDLFRELLAIVLLYSLGARYPHAGIGASAATAMDTTLPIIKQICPPDDLPMALVSGLCLSMLAPFLMSFFLLYQSGN